MLLTRICSARLTRNPFMLCEKKAKSACISIQCGEPHLVPVKVVCEPVCEQKQQIACRRSAERESRNLFGGLPKNKQNIPHPPSHAATSTVNHEGSYIYSTVRCRSFCPKLRSQMGPNGLKHPVLGGCSQRTSRKAYTWVARHASFRSHPSQPASTSSSESQHENANSSGKSTKTDDDDDDRNQEW